MVEPLRLRVAAVLSLLSAAMTLPVLAVVLWLSGTESPEGDLLVAAFELISVAMSTVIYPTLGVLVATLGLNVRPWTTGYVVLGWLGLIPTAISLARPELETAMDAVSLVFLFLAGITLVGLGVALLRWDHPFHGLRSSLGGLHVATGIALFTIICLPLALMTGMGAEALQALLFFRAARAAEQDAPPPA